MEPNLPTEASNISSLKQFKFFIRKADLTKILDTNPFKAVPFALT